MKTTFLNDDELNTINNLLNINTSLSIEKTYSFLNMLIEKNRAISDAFEVDKEIKNFIETQKVKRKEKTSQPTLKKENDAPKLNRIDRTSLIKNCPTEAKEDVEKLSFEELIELKYIINIFNNACTDNRLIADYISAISNSNSLVQKIFYKYFYPYQSKKEREDEKNGQ